MSLLDFFRKKLLGEANVMQPSGFEPGVNTQGLFGQGGQFGGGLLQNNLSQMNQGEGGLLSNIPQSAILGSAIYGQGIKGKDPLEAFFPAAMQTAQLKSALTPQREKLMTAYDPKTKKNVFATRTQIEERGLTPVPESPETTASQKDYSALLKVMETGTDLQKKVARIIYGKPGRDPMSKTEFLSKVTTNLSKDALADPDEIQKILPKWEQVYDEIANIQTPSIDKNNIQTPSIDQNMLELPENFKGSLEEWNKLKSSNPDTPDKDLIEYFNRKYGG